MIENIIYAFIVVFSLSLLTIALLSFRRSRNVKIALVTAAFALFLAKGILFSMQLFIDAMSQESLWIGSGLLDIGILATIFLATLKR